MRGGGGRGGVAVWGVGRVGLGGHSKMCTGACRAEDQLQPVGSPRRIYNARVGVMEWFWFSSSNADADMLTHTV